jgi:glucosamine-6-phosphate deaminase
MMTNFFTHVDIDPNNAHILDGNAVDLQAECMNYERLIEEAGGVHLFIGGIYPSILEYTTILNGGLNM